LENDLPQCSEGKDGRKRGLSVREGEVREGKVRKGAASF
jgi:hypothetical protein